MEQIKINRTTLNTTFMNSGNGRCNFVKAMYVWIGIILLAISTDARATGKPGYNVVLIVSDQHKRSVAGCYGDPTAITPNIDKLAENGVRFTNFYSPSPLCAPARAAMLTGMMPYANGALYHKQVIKDGDNTDKETGAGYFRDGYGLDLVTLAEVLKNSGYGTAAIGKMHVHGELQEGVNADYPEGNSMGFDHSAMRYFTHFPGGHYSDAHGEDVYERYREFGAYKGLNKLNTDKRSTLVEDYDAIFDVSVVAQSENFIREKTHEGENFFIHVGLEKPHLPWTTSQKYTDLYKDARFVMPATSDNWLENGRFPWISNWLHNPMAVKEPEKARNAMAAYYACVSEVDDMVGRIVKVLKETGAYENTIIIYTSDHGEHLFNKGLIGKHCMFENAAGIPFIISCPALFPKNTTVNSIASLIDIFPTICDVLQIRKPAQLQGRSLYREIVQRKDVRNVPVYSEYHEGGYALFPKEMHLPTRMVRMENLKYIYTHGMMGQLYDLNKDPDELDNLAFHPDYQESILKFNLLTLNNWTLDRFPLLKVEVIREKGKKYLEWDTFQGAGHYVVFRGKHNDPSGAKLIAGNVKGTRWEAPASEKGYFWVLAVPRFEAYAERYDKVPIALDKLPYQLPCSEVVKL